MLDLSTLSVGDTVEFIGSNDLKGACCEVLTTNPNYTTLRVVSPSETGRMVFFNNYVEGQIPESTMREYFRLVQEDSTLPKGPHFKVIRKIKQLDDKWNASQEIRKGKR